MYIGENRNISLGVNKFSNSTVFKASAALLMSDHGDSSSNPAGDEIFSELTSRFFLYKALHVHPSVILICLKYCCKGHKIPPKV